MIVMIVSNGIGNNTAKVSNGIENRIKIIKMKSHINVNDFLNLNLFIRRSHNEGRNLNLILYLSFKLNLLSYL